jgi:WD40 repeat protein
MAGQLHSVARTFATDSINGLCLSADGQLLAAASWDGTVRVLDFDTGRTRRALRGHEGRFYSVAVHPDSHMLASAGTDAVVRAWDCETGRALWERTGHDGLIYCIAFQPQGGLLA